MFVVKECSKCKEYKMLEDYYGNKGSIFGKSTICKVCQVKNSTKYINKNIDKYTAYSAEYRQKNRDYYRKYSKEWQIEKRKTDEMFKMKHCISSLVRSAFKNKGYSKGSKTFDIIGCSYEEFVVHIEKQFKDGMTWNNHGEWHLDHIYPISLAKDEQHIIELNHYTNFQPLWADENIRKGKKLI